MNYNWNKFNLIWQANQLDYSDHEVYIHTMREGK